MKYYTNVNIIEYHYIIIKCKRIKKIKKTALTFDTIINGTTEAWQNHSISMGAIGLIIRVTPAEKHSRNERARTALPSDLTLFPVIIIIHIIIHIILTSLHQYIVLLNKKTFEKPIQTEKPTEFILS